LALPMLQGSVFPLFVHISCVKSNLLELFYHIAGESRRRRPGTRFKNQRSKIKMTSQSERKLKKPKYQNPNAN